MCFKIINSVFYDEDETQESTMKQIKPEQKESRKLFNFFKTKKSFRMKEPSPYAGKKKFESIRNRVYGLSQELRNSVRIRKPSFKPETPAKCVTPSRKTKRILGRTPTKLYSPFDIETPPSDKTVWSYMDTSTHGIGINTPIQINKLEHLEKKKCQKARRNVFRKLCLKPIFYDL